MSNLEATFDTYWRQLDGPVLVSEYKFSPTRRWRFDRAHPASYVAVELDGGTFTGGRHVSGYGFALDCEKINAAQAMGWAVFRLTTDMLRDDPFSHIKQIIATVENRAEE